MATPTSTPACCQHRTRTTWARSWSPPAPLDDAQVDRLACCLASVLALRTTCDDLLRRRPGTPLWTLGYVKRCGQLPAVRRTRTSSTALRAATVSASSRTAPRAGSAHATDSSARTTAAAVTRVVETRWNIIQRV